MVSANVDALSDSFESIISDRDVAGAATLGLAGAAGGVVATQAAGRIAPLIGMEAQPSGLQGLFVNGTVKMLVGAGLGLAAIRLGGTPGLVLGIAGLGGLILGGGDWINAVLSQSAGVPGAQTARQMYNNSGNASARVVSSSTSTTANASRGREEEMDFRQVAQNGNVEFR